MSKPSVKDFEYSKFTDTGAIRVVLDSGEAPIGSLYRTFEQAVRTTTIKFYDNKTNLNLKKTLIITFVDESKSTIESIEEIDV